MYRQAPDVSTGFCGLHYVIRMGAEISLAMRGVGGTLRYCNGNESYEIPVENTGDYSRGTLVFVRELDAQITGDSAQQRKSQILRDLQAWSKTTGNKLCW